MVRKIKNLKTNGEFKKKRTQKDRVDKNEKS